MLHCFLLVKADRVLDYCKKGPAEPAVVCGIKKMKTGVFGERKKKSYAHTHTHTHTKVYKYTVAKCLCTFNHARPNKVFFTRTLEYNA